jgi:hypothetical protein
MALVQGLERADGDCALVRAEVVADSMFAREDGTVEPLAILEAIAQACAAFGGFKAASAAIFERRGAGGVYEPAPPSQDDEAAMRGWEGSPPWVSHAPATPTDDCPSAMKAAFLVAVRSFEVEGPVLVGESIFVEVALVREFGGFHLFEGAASQHGLRVAKASLKAYHPGPGRDMPST